MKSVPSELMKEYVQSQHFTSTADIMAAMKEMFQDVVQTVMEVEMDEALGRERCQRAETAERPNYRNGYTKKTVKPNLLPVIERRLLTRQVVSGYAAIIRSEAQSCM